MFIDEMKIHIRAGRGGNGVVSWHHEKGKEFGGPDGGNGGKGGDIYVKAIRDMGRLAKYRHEKEFVAPNGGSGKKNSMHGANGEDLEIELPLGSLITHTKTGKQVDLVTLDERILLLKGGNGGLGNEHFKASTNVRPYEWTPGKNGEEGDFFIELQLVADAGFVGLPNAGKSSLLNALTEAQAKVGNYQFTTLEPNLGDMHGYILADIPGLIEGAHEGKGLGHKFLRHIKRTRTIMHCVSVENEDVAETYDVVRKELESYGDGLESKPEILVLTKTDMVTNDVLKEKLKVLKKKNKNILSVSIIDDESLKKFQDELVKILQ